MELTRTIAKINRTFLGFEDHGILTGLLFVSYGDSRHQGIGSYAITQVAGPYLEHTLKACGVDSWEQLQGRTIYVLTDSDGRVAGIEPLPTETGVTFLFSDVFGVRE